MKNCPKCNAELADDAMFCNSCGEKLDAAPAEKKEADPVVQNDTLDAADEKAKNTATGKIVIAAVAAAIVLVIAIVIVVIVNANAYKKPMDALVANLNKKSTSVTAYLDTCTPAFAGKTYDTVMSTIKSTSKDAYDEIDENINTMFEDAYEGIEDQFGEKYKISYIVRSKEKMKKKELREVQSQCEDIAKLLESAKLDDEETYDKLSDMLDDEFDVELKEKDIQKFAKLGDSAIKELEGIKVTDGYTVKIKVTIKGEDDDDDAAMKIQVIKANGKWIINPLYSIEVEGNTMGSLYNEIRYNF